MNIAVAKDQIKDTVEAYLQKDDVGMYVIDQARQRPMFLVGAPGIGKTAIISQIAQELQIGVVSYSMTHHTRQSALGLPRIVHREYEGFGYDASEFTMSEIVAAVYDYMDRTGMRRGILFLDEINCVSETLYPSMLQFLQFKTFGQHRIPDDWVIVCAGNPPEYNKSVHEFDVVTLDRLREIDVEPDYPAWRRYAQEKGIHPAITTFLEAKPDCFYKIESKPGGGKSFVTARAWEDLGEVLSLYEEMEKTCDRELFVQFLRDDEIADKFSVYYKLFDKYRSDYQVGRILAGDADLDIEIRAKNAEFDERVALLGLLLDALATECNRALDQEGLVLQLRDELRAAKPRLMGGETVEEAVETPRRDRLERLERKVSAGTAKLSYQRSENLVIAKLRDIVDACTLANTLEGERAFETVNAEYRKEVEMVETLVRAADEKMNNTFFFLEKCFGNAREMIVFVAELTTRSATMQYIAHYGNDRYYAHNDELQVDETRRNLSERVAALAELASDDEKEEIDYSEYNDLDMGSGVGLTLGGKAPNMKAQGDAESHASDAETHASDGDGKQKPVHNIGGVVSGESDDAQAKMSDYYGDEGREDGFTSLCKMTLPDEPDIDGYYLNREHEFGFASMSRMTLPSLNGKVVLDVCCRRGKGVYKLSALVGEKGRVIGVDWSADYIAEAEGGSEHARRKNHLDKSNMEFHVAYPEDLMQAGIGNGTVDAVYINNVMTLLYDPAKALQEFSRVLKPGGLLICETIFSDKERDPQVVQQARAMGNSVQAGRTQKEFFDMLEAAGFGTPEIVDEYEVEADQGFKANHKVAIAETDEDVKFKAVAINVLKA